MNKYPLEENGGVAAIKHWKEHRPKMYRELQRAGRLEAAAYAAQELTKDALAQQMSQGANYHLAWEAIKQEWIYLPDERTQPSLGTSPLTWEAPPNPDEE